LLIEKVEPRHLPWSGEEVLGRHLACKAAHATDAADERYEKESHNPLPILAPQIGTIVRAAQYGVLGHLAEEFDLRARYDVRSARRWYPREALRVAPYLLRNWWRMRRREDIKRCAGVFAGYAATRLDRHAPLSSALLIAVTWSAVSEAICQCPGAW
jgi:hypothetical protein